MIWEGVVGCGVFFDGRGYIFIWSRVQVHNKQSIECTPTRPPISYVAMRHCTAENSASISGVGYLWATSGHK